MRAQRSNFGCRRLSSAPRGASGDKSDMSVAPGVATVLVCDDDDDVRRFLSDLLKANGYMVCEASGAGAAFRILEESAAVDLLIVDYAMPGINGLGHHSPSGAPAPEPEDPVDHRRCWCRV